MKIILLFSVVNIALGIGYIPAWNISNQTGRVTVMVVLSVAIFCSCALSYYLGMIAGLDKNTEIIEKELKESEKEAD